MPPHVHPWDIQCFIFDLSSTSTQRGNSDIRFYCSKFIIQVEMQDEDSIIPCAAIPAVILPNQSNDPSDMVASDAVSVAAEATPAAPEEPARVRVNTSALTGVRSMAFLNVATGHFVFTLKKPFHVDLMGMIITLFACVKVIESVFQVVPLLHCSSYLAVMLWPSAILEGMSSPFLVN